MNQIWCSDITYIWTGQRWAYLAAVLDLYVRCVVGWAMSERPDTDLVCKALVLATPVALSDHAEHESAAAAAGIMRRWSGYFAA